MDLLPYREWSTHFIQGNEAQYLDSLCRKDCAILEEERTPTYTKTYYRHGEDWMSCLLVRFRGNRPLDGQWTMFDRLK